MLSGLACPGPGGVSAGAGAVLVLLLSVYTLSRLVTLPLPASFRPSMLLSVNRCGFAPFLPAIIQSDGSGRGVSCFALVYAVIRCFISVFLRIFSVILCFSADFLRYTLFLSLRTSGLLLYILFYCGTSYLGGRSVMRVNRGFFARARRALYHVRLFARVCAYIIRFGRYNARRGLAW